MDQDDDKTMVTLLYNDREEVVVNRRTLARAVPYFNCLLYGYFKETKQSRISIRMSRIFPFHIFEAAIEYACTGDIEYYEDIDYYISLGVLARYWIFDKLTEFVQERMMTMIDIETVCDIQTYSSVLGFQSVFEECLIFGRMLDIQGTLERNTPRCAILEHDHHYMNCPGFEWGRHRDDNWDFMSKPPKKDTGERIDLSNGHPVKIIT